MIAIPLIQSFIFIAYISYVEARYGVLSSISDSYYQEGDKWNYLFHVFIWGLAIPTAILGGYFGVWFFLSGGFLLFVSGAAAFREQDQYTGTIHSVGATLAVVTALIGLVVGKVYVPVGVCVAVTAIITLKKVANMTWWNEIIALMTIIWGVIDLVR